jgi:hypothetical protein
VSFQHLQSNALTERWCVKARIISPHKRPCRHLDEVFGWISRGVEEHLVYKG